MPTVTGPRLAPALTAAVSRWTSVGTSTTLPATLANGTLALRFVAHGTYGVTLDTVTHTSHGQDYAWTNAQTSDPDLHGTVTGQLWRLALQSASECSRECSSECGAGIQHLDPSGTVAVTSGQDRDGRPALVFRWSGLALPHGGTVDVTLVCALGTGDDHARWTTHVVRAGTEADGIEYIEAPMLAIRGPVAARSAMTHAASQVRSRVLLPANVMPALSSESVPLSRWSGRSLLTHHPAGHLEHSTTQPLQFEALAALDPLDTASFRRVLLLATRDTRGRCKQTFRRHATADAGATALWVWSHRYYPSWSDWPIETSADTDRFGNVHHAEYEVLTGCIEAPTAAWWHSAATWYRREVADQMPAVGKRHDTARTDLARGLPFAVDRTTGANLGPAALAHVTETWGGEIRAMLAAATAYVQVTDLNPSAATQPASAIDPHEIRGTNYLPVASTSHCLHLGLVPLKTPSAGRPTTSDGFFHESHVRDEIQRIADAGFNNLRVWGSCLGYIADKAGYLASCQTLARLCRERGIGITYVMWNKIPAGSASSGGSAYGISQGVGHSPAAIKSALWSLCDAWQGSPSGPTLVPPDEDDLSHWPEPFTAQEFAAQGRFGDWTDATWEDLVRDYTQDMARLWGHNPVCAPACHSVDLFNEPNPGYGVAGAQDAMEDFIAKTERAMRTIWPNMNATVGWAGSGVGLSERLVRRGVTLSYHSAHLYFGNPTASLATALSEIAAAKAEANAWCGGKLVVSECVILPENVGHVASILAMLDSQECGVQFWSYLQNNSYRDAGFTSGGYSWPIDGWVTCTKPMRQVLTTDTLTFANHGGEFGPECSRECSRGWVADRLALEAWLADP